MTTRVIPAAFAVLAALFATALSATVGLGNIAGVAVAIGTGGAWATFWLILAGLQGVASKFTECTLGVKYRNEYPMAPSLEDRCTT